MPLLRGSIACYPPVWGIDSPGGPISGDERESVAAHRRPHRSDRDAVSARAALIYGDKGAALCDPYYPKHADCTTPRRDEVIAWRRFALRCRDLFLDGEDTSWYEIGDENGAVSILPTLPCGRNP